MLRRAALVLFAVLPATAYADSSSLFTVGVGAAFGVARTEAPGEAARATFGPDLELRLRFLYVLGAEIAFTPVPPSQDQTLSFESTMRLSALLYLIPLDSFGLYAKAGVGGTGIGDLVTLTADDNSYHLGGGLEVYLGDHFAVGAEMVVLVPGVMTVIESVARRSLEARASTAVEPEPEVGDYLSPRNFRISLALRYFL